MQAGRNVFVVPALVILMSGVWGFAAIAAQSNRLATLLANPAFCVLLAWSICRVRAPAGPLIAAHAFGTVAAILLGILSAFVGAAIFEAHPLIGDLLMRSLSLGYYPPGPDVPFVIGVVPWGFSIALLVFIGVGAGLAIRKLTQSKKA